MNVLDMTIIRLAAGLVLLIAANICPRFHQCHH